MHDLKKISDYSALLITFSFIVLAVVSNNCKAGNIHQIESIRLSDEPCLVNVNNKEYEWGTQHSGSCFSLNNQSDFLPIENHNVQKKIVWIRQAANIKPFQEQCIKYRGHYDKLPEIGVSGCLCSVQQPDGVYKIGMEQISETGIKSCMTENQSVRDYLVARKHFSKVLSEQEPESGSTLGYIVKGGFAVLLVMSSAEICAGVNLANVIMGTSWALLIAIRHRDLSVLNPRSPH